MKTLIFLCLFVVNFVAFSMYGVDKVKAQRKRRRISELALFGIALLGGSLGAWLGMQIFRHKTRHWYFQIGIPMILVIQVVLLLWLVL